MVTPTFTIKTKKPGLQSPGFFYAPTTVPNGTILHMDTSIRIQTKVLPGHRIEIAAPEWTEGSAVDVLVMLKEPATCELSRQEILRLPIERRREILAEQSERLSEYYEKDHERSDRQGGDIND